MVLSKRELRELATFRFRGYELISQEGNTWVCGGKG
jgi:hypothetical protein